MAYGFWMLCYFFSEVDWLVVLVGPSGNQAYKCY